MAGVGGQRVELQQLLGRWKGPGKSVRPKMILGTMILSTDKLVVAWQSERVPGVGITNTEFQTPPSHQLMDRLGSLWASVSPSEIMKLYKGVSESSHSPENLQLLANC